MDIAIPSNASME